MQPHILYIHVLNIVIFWTLANCVARQYIHVLRKPVTHVLFVTIGQFKQNELCVLGDRHIMYSTNREIYALSTCIVV